MNQKTKPTQKDWILFIGVMVVFIIGMIVMMVSKVTNVWIWVGYLIIWTYAEIKVAKNVHLKWWVWVLIIGALGILDVFLISVFH